MRFRRSIKSEFPITDHEEVQWMKEVYKMIQKGNNQCKQLDLLEVYAYPNSNLTDTAIACGLRAKRFTREDGGLNSDKHEILPREIRI